MSSQVLVLRYAEFKATGIQERIEGSMHNTLRSDIHPPSGCHLTIVGNPHLGCHMPVLLIIEHTDHHRIGDNYPGSIRPGTKQTERMARFNHQGLLLCHDLQILFDQPVLHPVLTDLTCLSIRHQLIRIKGNVETEVIVNHYLESFSFQAVSSIIINGTCFQITLRTITIPIYPSTGTKLFHKFRC